MFYHKRFTCLCEETFGSEQQRAYEMLVKVFVVKVSDELIYVNTL